jgi:hypothetical protein
MRRSSRRCGAILGLGVILASTEASLGQEITPKVLVASPGLRTLAQELAERVRQLAQAVAADAGQTDVGRALVSDTRELAQAAEEFQTLVQKDAETFRVRRAFAGIDHSWHSLQSRLAQAGLASPAVARAIGQVVLSDARMHQTLGVNQLPLIYYGTGPALTGMAEVQRLGHALVDRAEALTAAIRTDMGGGPNGIHLVEQAQSLAKMADAFHDGLNLGADVALARNGFAGVAAEAGQMADALAPWALSSRVRLAWQSFKATEVLIRKSLGLSERMDPPALGPPPSFDRPTMLSLADQLIRQTDAFLFEFTQRAKDVPEGGEFIADARRLQAAATEFRNSIEQGLLPNMLAANYRDVDLNWQRLARRTNRIAQGRTGPYVQAIAQIGETTTELHRLLGLPGYPPVIVQIPPAP